MPVPPSLSTPRVEVAMETPAKVGIDLATGPDLTGLIGLPATAATIQRANAIWSNWATAASTNATWNNWNNCTIGSGSLYTNNGVVWKAWNTASSASITNTNLDANVWQYWVSNAVAGTAYIRPTPYVAETAQQREARETQQRQYAEERRLADKRAEALLCSHLNEEQQKDLRDRNWFLIDSKSGKTYRINRGRHANIDVIDENGVTIRSLCVHPRDTVPDADTMLAQVLMLKHDEDTLLRMANPHRVDHHFRKGPVPAPIPRRAAPLLRLVA